MLFEHRVDAMVEYFSIKNLSIKSKIELLEALGYKSDGKFVLDENGKRCKDKYVDIDITLDRMLIFPGSTIILDNNELSIASYLEEYPDVIQ